MSAALEGLLMLICNPEPRFMDERGGLESLTGSFAREFRGGQSPQFVINERQEFLSGFGVTLLNAVQDLGYVAYLAMLTRWRGTEKVETSLHRCPCDESRFTTSYRFAHPSRVLT